MSADDDPKNIRLGGLVGKETGEHQAISPGTGMPASFAPTPIATAQEPQISKKCRTA